MQGLKMPEEGINSLETVLQTAVYPMCVLGTKPGSSEGADSALNHEVISPNPSFYSLMFIQVSEVTASVLGSDLFILLI